MTFQAPKSLIEKLWGRHTIAEMHGRTLLHADLNLIHEGSRHAFAALTAEGHQLRRPERTVAFADHYVPTAGRPRITDDTAAEIIALLAGNASAHGILHLGMEDPRQGIIHVAAPELGMTLPGMFLVCADSHVATHGALGVLTRAIGATELRHVMLTQAVWMRRPRSMRIRVDGHLGPGIGAKDLALHAVAEIGANGASGHVVEFGGSAIRALSIEARATLCNMSIEMGAVAGMVAPDDATLAYVHGRPYAPRADLWEAAAADWRGLASDPGASFDREWVVDGTDVAPMTTWGTSPQDSLPIDGLVPDPASLADLAARRRAERALAYMALTPGTPLREIAIDRVFIGSCTNARIEDLRTAATVLRGRKAALPGIVVPGSKTVKLAAEAEGLDRIFREAGLDWRDPGCSMCVGVNGDLLMEGMRCAATSNRNFEGRQGAGVRTHLMGPAMAAATALTGRLTDPRPLMQDAR